MTLTELPLGLPGRLFRSPMPFSAFDPEDRALSEFEQHEVRVVVVLAEESECEIHASCDLMQAYAQRGLDVIHLPVPDYHAVSHDKLRTLIDDVLAHLRAGRNVAIHCRAGRGRTGTLAACLAKEVLGLSGNEALEWIRTLVPGSIETVTQEALVRAYRPIPRADEPSA